MVREHCPTPGIGACAEWCGTHCGPACCRSASWIARKACSTSWQLPHAGRFICDPMKGMAHLRPVKDIANHRVMVWQGERNADGRLAHMYWPVVGTIITGLVHANVAVVVGLGFSLDYHRELASLRRGDTLIWVGAVGIRSQPWGSLRARGVRAVLYQTEPRDLRRQSERCQFLNGTVSEMWDFSWSNIDRCASSLWAPRLRYIPPGYLGRPGLRASSPTLNSKTMLFIGTLTDVNAKERRRTYRSLKQRLGGRLQHTSEQGEHQRICPGCELMSPVLCLADNAWNNTAIAALMQRFDIFLNLHKDVYAARPVTFRNAVLLTEGKLIVSERAYAKDETEYEGMILFSDDIVSDYHRLVDDVDVATQFLRRSSEKFPARFAPVELFRRAGIYSDWGLIEHT